MLRHSEWVLVAYFTYTGVLALVLPMRPPIPAVTIGTNLALLAGLAILGRAEPRRHWEPLRVMRDWYPLPSMLLAYREMGWFAPATHNYVFEKVWVEWDRLLLNDLHLRSAIELLGPVAPSVLEMAYSLVYSIPAFCLAILYICRARARVNAFLFVFLLAILSAYALFPYFPSEPPRTVFPGQDFPSFNTVFRKFNWWLLGGYGIHTSVFPSAHVSGAFAGALAMIRLLPEHPWIGRFLLVLAILIATATVYGRYHYAADAAAGLVLALLAFKIGDSLRVFRFR